MWTPDVYDGAPTPVTAFMAIVPKLAIGAILAKVLFDVFGGISDKWQIGSCFSFRRIHDYRCVWSYRSE